MLAILVVTACANGERTAPAAEPGVVPPVRGAVVGDAVSAVQAAGLRVELTDGSAALAVTSCAGGIVTAQDVTAGTELVRGSTVVLTVSGCGVTPPPP